MDESSKKVFKDSCETIYMYYAYLHLGSFYSQLSKHEDLSNKSQNILIDTGTGKFQLRRDIIQNSLSDIYKKSSSPDLVFNLILNNSIRGITMALFEALKDTEIKNLFLKEIFRNNIKDFNDFKEVVRFIRNTFSHNIRDKIELKRGDFLKYSKNKRKKKKKNGKSEEELWLELIDDLEKKRRSPINFFFDYAKSPIPLELKNYTVNINIDFNQIKDGVVYTDIISEYQSLMFIELCYNCMYYLKEN